jgi:Mg-chelatase subunit ChlD
VATQQGMSPAESKAVAAAALAEVKSASESVRLDAWRSVFEKTNRILSSRAINVKVVPGEQVPGNLLNVPGWSDGETIHFNGPLVLDMLRMKDALAAVLRLKGLNYHELSHVLFTPRQSEELPRKVIDRATKEGDPTWWWAMNALEDQRIETWFTASYGPSRRYFEAAVLQWLITDGNAEAAVLLHGRKYLSAKIRVQAEQVFVKKYSVDLLQRFQAVIDQYLTVVLPTDSVRAFLLVSKYRDLLKEMQNLNGQQPLPKMPVEDNGVHGHGVPQKGDPSTVRTGKVTSKEAKDAAKAAAKAIEKADKADQQARKDLAQKAAEKAAAEQKDDADDGADGGSEQGENGGDAGQGSGQQPGSAPAQQGGGTDDGGTDTDASNGGDTGAGEGGSGAGDSGGVHEVLDGVSLSDAMKDLIDEAHADMDDIEQDAEVQADAARVLDAVKAVVNNGKQDAAGELAHKGGSIEASTEHLVAQRRVKTLLTRIRQEVEPQILRRQEAGRIDVRRLLSRRPNETDIFTSYDEGMEDETGMEVVVLVDISGSMSGVMTEASAAVWVLKRALDALDIRCTVLAYDTEHYIVYQPGQRAKARVSIINSMGGTDPTSALREAQRIFAKSHQPSKVLVTITDGQWGGNPTEMRGLMKAMHVVGVQTMLLGLQNAFKHYGKHDHHIGHDMTSVSELPKAVTKLVAQIMRAKTGQV